MPKLFTVQIETEVVVLAESQKEAEKIAESDFYDIAEVQGASNFSFRASDMRYLPCDWELHSIPFGHQEKDDPDRPIKEWIDLGAAPNYKKP